MHWLREVPWWHGPTQRRYWLFQVPGTIIVFFVLLIAAWFAWIEVRIVFIGLGLWFLKDLALFPFTWRAYFVEDHHEGVRLEGETATVVDELNPKGYIRTHGELWQARLEADSGSIAAGEQVRILRREGMLLLVEPPDDKTRA